MSKLPSVPHFGEDTKSIAAALLAIKEIVEVLAGQRGDPNDRAVTLTELNAALARLK